MDGEKRREMILELLRTEKEPLSGTALAGKLGVSRQVIVQDIALLRATNKNILSTNKGYLLFGKGNELPAYRRVFSVSHTDSEIQEELNMIVDAGAKVLDVIVAHEVYGQIAVDLFITSRRDVEEFVEKIKSDRAKPLKILTDNIHYHTVEAATEEILNVVETRLKERGILTTNNT